MERTTILRRGAPVVLAIALAAALAVPAVAAGPVVTPIDEETILYDGYCAFPVLLEDSHSSVKELAFAEDRGGSLHYDYPGVFQSTLTRLDPGSGATTDIVLGSRLRFVERADGSAGATATGSFLLYYTEEEAPLSDVGQGLFLGRGHAHEEYDENGLVSATFRGSLIDLCALLDD